MLAKLTYFLFSDMDNIYAILENTQEVLLWGMHEDALSQ